MLKNEKTEKLTKEKVYEKVGEIPEGCFSTYKIVADELGSKAYQLIGNFLQKHDCQLNPDGRTVNCFSKTRCYTVIKHDYSLGSFKFDNGEDKPLVKKSMLEKERIRFEKRGEKWYIKEVDRTKRFTFHKGKCGCKKCKD